VNLALLKAEMLHARWRRDGLPLRERILSNVDLLGKLGCLMPKLTNQFLGFKPARIALEKAIGISARRSLPHYANERFDKWFAKHCSGGAHRAPPQKKRGKIILWDDTFVRYHEPHIGIAAIKVLEALGFEVSLVKNRRCCGRPAFSQGNLAAAVKLGKHNVGLLASLQYSNTPIIFLEPSCWSMFAEDYGELKIENAENIAARCFLFEKFVDDLLAREPEALRFKHESRSRGVLIHPHCHAKSITSPMFMGKLAERLPGIKATVLDTACCGMAGAFGALAEKYDLSVQIAQRLLDQIDNQPRTLSGSAARVEVIASGTSCRHQITDLTNLRPKHMVELLAEAL
jgi:Fe-S oxidoreductase